MEIQIETTAQGGIAELISDQEEIKTVQDALDFMVNCIYQGAESMIIRQHQLTPAFFDLKTGIAGEILQKFSNYRARLAIVGDFGSVQNQSLRDFIYESNKQGRVIFTATREEAVQRFSKG